METVKKIRSNFNSSEEILLFLQIFFLITMLPLIIKLLTVPQLMKILTPKNARFNKKSNLKELKDKIEKYTDYILSRNFWIYRNICLKRSLILYHFLRKLGISVQVCFGVRYKKEPLNRDIKKKLEGHSWLLCNENIFMERNPEQIKTYKMTYCFPERK